MASSKAPGLVTAEHRQLPMTDKTKPAAFLLIKTNSNAIKIANSIEQYSPVAWASVVYGPYQIVAYVEGNDERKLSTFIENVRSRRDVAELDARICKSIPEDARLKTSKMEKPNSAVLLINVDYKEEKERTTANNLRRLKGVRLTRAMWGPTDIIAVVEASDPEAMRNLICDQVKSMKGVRTNTTLYCYPEL